MSDNPDCIVLPRDFVERGGLGKGADDDVVSTKSSGEETSVRPEATESLPSVEGRGRVDDDDDEG